MTSRLKITIVLIFTMLLCHSTSALADGHVHINTGAQPSELETYAAEELETILQRLFGVETSIGAQDTDHPTVFLGNPGSNKTLAKAIGDLWPKVTDQGIVVKSHPNGRAIFVGGGSDAATLWAVYEFGYQHGVRYLLRDGDVYPDVKSLDLSSLDVVDEPEFRTRTWRTVNDFAIGPESWSLDEHRSVLQQLAKHRFNNVMISVYAWQPYVHYSFNGIDKRTALMWYGEKLDLPPGAPGRNALRGLKVFENPHFSGKSTYEEMIVAGESYLKEIIKEATRLGMTTGIVVNPFQYPKEFKTALEGAVDARGLNDLTIRPGANQSFDDKQLQLLAKAKIRAYLHTYTDVDYIYITMPEFPEWGEHAVDAWEMLRSGVDVKLPELEELIKAVESRGIIASGERGKQALKGNVVGLAFLRSLLANHEDLLNKPNGDSVKLVVRNVDAELFPYLSALLPKDAETLNFIDYTARRVDENSEYLKKPQTDKVKCRFVMTLADDNIGPLSQQVTQRLEKIINKLRDAGWDGFSTRYWLMADLDPVVHFLGRAAWDPATTARNAHDSLFAVITEKQEVADRLWLAMQAIEKATEITDKNDIGFNFPVRGMLMKHHHNQPVPEWWEEVNELYTNAMVEIYRSHDASPPKAKRLLFYWGKRGEYVVEYLSVIKSVREAAIANAAGDSEKALEHYETAMENLYNAIDTLSDIVKDQGDRGLIAVLNKFAFEALNEAFEKALDAE